MAEAEVGQDRRRRSLLRGNPARRLTSRYVLGLGLLAVLVVSHHLLAQFQIRAEQDDVGLVRLATEQQAMTTRVIDFSRRIDRLEPEDRPAAARDLLTLVDTWRSMHEQLAAGDPTVGPIPRSNAALREALDDAEPYVQAIHEAATAIGRGFSRPNVTPEDRASIDLALDDLANNEVQVKDAVERLGRAFADEASTGIRHLALLEFAIMIGMLAVLAAEAIFIFAPAAAALRRQVAQLGESERRYRSLFEHSPDGILLLDPGDRRIIDANGAICTMLDSAPEVLRAGPAFASGAAEHLRDLILERWRGGEHEFETTIARDDRDIECLVSLRPLELDGGSRVHVIVRDITRTNRAEARVQANSQMLEDILANMPAILWSCDRRGLFTESRGAGLRRLGLADHESIGLSVAENYPEGWPHICRAMEGETVSFEVSREGRTEPWAFRTVVFRDPVGDGVIGFSIDITERKLAEQAMLRSQRFLQASLDALSPHIAVLDEQGGILAVNEAWRRSGRDARVLTAHAGDPDAVDEDGARLSLAVRSVLDGERPDARVESRRDRDGRWFQARVSRFVHDGRIRIVVAHEDISEAKAAGQRLRESEERFRAVVENMPVMLNAFDREGRPLFWNRECERVTGFLASEVVGPTGAEATRSLVQHARRRGDFRYWEAQLDCADGSTRTIAWSSICGHVPIPGWPIWAIGIDVTARKQADEQLLSSLELQRLLLAELDHRVKNTLGGLLTMIDLSASGAQSVESFAANMRRRVQSMVSMHAMLSDSHWQPVDIKSILRTMVPSDAPGHVVLHGPPVAVAPQQATPLGMIVQELMSNSLKYGALNASTGRVDIGWRLETASAAEQLLVLTWGESGGPPIEHAPAAGLGTDLMRGFARFELRGDIELDYPRSGARHVLRARLVPPEPATELRHETALL